MKLEEIQQLLNLPYKAEICLKEISLDFIHEMARYFNCEINSYSNEKGSIANTWISIKNDSIELTLNTSKF